MTAYRKNAGAVFSLKYHVVWCPKYRRAVLVGAVAERLEALLREKIADEGLTVHGKRSGVEDEEGAPNRGQTAAGGLDIGLPVRYGVVHVR